MIQEQIKLLQGLLLCHKTQLDAKILTDKSKKFLTKAIHNFTSHFKHVCLKKKVAENCDQVREDDTSAKTDAHTNYDAKYEMIHNFF